MDDLSGDEEDLKELEAFLYSTLHQEQVSGSNVTVDEYHVSHREIEFLDRDCDDTQPTDVKEDQGGLEEVDSGIGTTDAPASPELIVLDSTSTSDSSDDDGIQVLSYPEVVRREAEAKHKTGPVTISSIIEEWLSSDSDPSSNKEAASRQDRIRETQRSLTYSSAKKESSRKRAWPLPSRLTEVHERSDEKKLKVNKRFQQDVDSSSSGSDDSGDLFLLTQEKLRVNLVGSSRQRDSHNSFESIIGHQIRPKFDAVVPLSWCKDMAKYYNEVDDSVVDKSIHDVLNSLTRSKESWPIDSEDLCRSTRSSLTPARYHQRKRCNNCNTVGHLARACSEPKKIISCSICGRQGHHRSKCKNVRCLGCGKIGEPLAAECQACRHWRRNGCVQCGVVGHNMDSCPDNWRRYHLTIGGSDPIVEPDNDVHRQESDAWCSNCGSKGHHLHKCTAYRHSPYPHPVLQVGSYATIKYVNPISKRKQKKMIKELKKRVSRSSLTAGASVGVAKGQELYGGQKYRYNLFRRKEKRKIKKIKLQRQQSIKTKKKPRKPWKEDNFQANG